MYTTEKKEKKTRKKNICSLCKILINVDKLTFFCHRRIRNTSNCSSFKLIIGVFVSNKRNIVFFLWVVHFRKFETFVLKSETSIEAGIFLDKKNV